MDAQLDDHDVHLVELAAQETAVIKASTTWQQFPHVWKGMLDEVWAACELAGCAPAVPM